MAEPTTTVELQEWQIDEIRQGQIEADLGDFATEEEVAAVFSKWTLLIRNPAD